MTSFVENLNYYYCYCIYIIFLFVLVIRPMPTCELLSHCMGVFYLNIYLTYNGVSLL